MKAATVALLGPLLAASGVACSAGGAQRGMNAGAAGASGGGGPASGSGGTAAVGGAGTPTACTPLGPIPRRIWRLSAEQWGNAVQSVLSLPSAPVLTSRGGESLYELFADSSLSVDSPMLYEMYTLLDAAAAQVDPMIATTIAPCAGTSPDAQTACATSFVKTFAALAYRRPIADDEVADLMTVYGQGAMTSYNAGIELVIKAVLASPSFLFRTELGPSTLTADAQGNFPDTTLTPYEVASQLSFTLLGNIPDAPLLAAAADGSLATAAGIDEQVHRLLSLPAAQTYLTGVVLNWFGVQLLFAKAKDASLVSALSLSGSTPDQTAIQNDLWTSAERFVSSILWSGSGRVDELLTSQTVYVNARLAKLYPDAMLGQIPADDGTFVAGTWPAAQGRSGLLTQPSFLWAVSDPALNSIVKRGKEVHDQVVCQDLIGSPIDLSAPGPANVLLCKSPDGTHTLSTCDSEILQSDARLAYQPCEVCHAQMDPYARVLQNFGPIGNYRTTDEAGRPINPVGTFVATEPPVPIPGQPNAISVPGSPLAPRTVTGAPALAAALVSSGVFDGCAAQQMLGVAIGQPIYTYDTCELQAIRAATDGTIDSLFVNLLSPDFMRARAGGPQ